MSSSSYSTLTHSASFQRSITSSTSLVELIPSHSVLESIDNELIVAGNSLDISSSPSSASASECTSSEAFGTEGTALQDTSLLDLVSHYPILRAIGKELTIDEVLNFGLTSKNIWSCIKAGTEQTISKSVTRNALTCAGLSIQIKPIDADDDAYHMPCRKKRGVDIKRCQGCGVGVCETCRFRITHGTILTMPMKRHWFFPARTESGTQLVTDNIECLVASFTRHGHGHDFEKEGPCDCSYEERWLKKWLCVPCLNRDLYAVGKDA